MFQTLKFPTPAQWPPDPDQFTPNPVNAGTWISPDDIRFTDALQLISLSYIGTVFPSDVLHTSVRFLGHTGFGALQGGFGFEHVGNLAGNWGFTVQFVSGAWQSFIVDPGGTTHNGPIITVTPGDVFDFYSSYNPNTFDIRGTIVQNGVQIQTFSMNAGPQPPIQNTYSWFLFVQQAPVVNPWTIDIGDLGGDIVEGTTPFLRVAQQKALNSAVSDEAIEGDV